MDNIDYMKKAVTCKKRYELSIKITNDGKDYVELNRRVVDTMMSVKGGYTANTLLILGVQWPPLKGWKRKLYGNKISKDDYILTLPKNVRPDIDREDIKSRIMVTELKHNPNLQPRDEYFADLARNKEKALQLQRTERFKATNKTRGLEK